MDPLDLLAFVLGPVNPALAALWLLVTIGLAILIVYLWDRVFKT